MTTRILGIVVAVACSVSGTAEATTNLKPFDHSGRSSVQAVSEKCHKRTSLATRVAPRAVANFTLVSVASQPKTSKEE